MTREMKKKPSTEDPKYNAVACVGDRGTYMKGILRLHRSLNEHGFQGARYFWQGMVPPGSPSHDAEPYAFKARAMNYARTAGSKRVLWADASVLAIKPLDQLFEALKDRPVLTWHSGWALGTWCTDNVLPMLELEREESMTIPMIAATAYGLNFEYEEAHYVVDTMLYYEKMGALRGPWKREHGYTSADPRVLGHRHDQTCLSAIFHRLKTEIEIMPYLFTLSDELVDETTCIKAIGIH